MRQFAINGGKGKGRPAVAVAEAAAVAHVRVWAILSKGE